MGNTIPQASASPLDLRTFLVSSSLPKSLIVTSKLSDRKFIKTLRCKFEDEDVVLKVHFREKATERSNEILRHMTMLEKRFRASHCVLPYRYASPSLWFFFFNKNKILSKTNEQDRRQIHDGSTLSYTVLSGKTVSRSEFERCVENKTFL